MSWTLYLPFATTVYIYGYTNAALSQQITAVPESGGTLTFTGSGEGNNPTSPPRVVINTPSTGSHLNGYQIVVTINTFKNGAWTPTQVAGAGCSLGLTAATYLVCSEDLVDNDWNDAVLQFLWYNPPSVINAAQGAMRAHIEASA